MWRTNVVGTGSNAVFSWLGANCETAMESIARFQLVREIGASPLKGNNITMTARVIVYIEMKRRRKEIMEKLLAREMEEDKVRDDAMEETPEMADEEDRES
ncbi:hypothetical protein RIF29_20758 [Crotalaria pallida]|uniref:Uncharacterized protein n=1 Tax=Crotalaria pallida TaxID=3830 RepID=A0AAN9I6L7_CROPI